ncbi:MAG: type I-MYXAN CRISPR-associated protein Cas5/Cmx5/DevS [Planctomycetia bacterium]|nr:type I-MYXAN CRISPR-associated protein Cas5/Cmx5/DevS [Planctomycetia bacterium]
MLGVYVTVPVACFRKGLAREYLETDPLPPPATCYGFLLSLVGETDRNKYIDCRVAPVLLSKPPTSTVLRTVWRVKQTPLGSPGNTRPDYQQLLTNVELAIWLASSTDLEDRVTNALSNPGSTVRFGGLSLGESTHMVDEVSLLDRVRARLPATGHAFLEREDKKGRLSMPVWVDHVGSAGSRYVTGDLELGPLVAPALDRMPRISPV